MSNKYTTGCYHLMLFDKHGTRADFRLRNSFVEARDEGEKLIKKPPYASYAVMRVLANSVDRAYPWSVKDETEIGTANS